MKKLLFGRTDVEIDHGLIKKKRDELIAQRGKKTIDPTDNIEHFKLLIQLSQEAKLGAGIEVMLNADILSSQLDYTTFASSMKGDVWNRFARRSVCSEVALHRVPLFYDMQVFGRHGAPDHTPGGPRGGGASRPARRR